MAICKKCNINYADFDKRPTGYCWECIGLLLDSIRKDTPTATAVSCDDTSVDYKSNTTTINHPYIAGKSDNGKEILKRETEIRKTELLPIPSVKVLAGELMDSIRMPGRISPEEMRWGTILDNFIKILSKYGYSPLVPITDEKIEEVVRLFISCFTDKAKTVKELKKNIREILQGIGTKEVDIDKLAEEIDNYYGEVIIEGSKAIRKGKEIDIDPIENIKAILTKYFIG